MGQKVNSALEAEKVSVASQIFNPADPQELAPTAAELAAADAEETVEVEEPEAELDLEDEVEAAFEEEVDAESN